jgi:hypothetical protein
MRREEGFVRREDEPTRRVRVPRLRLTPETGKILKVTLDGTEPATRPEPGPQRAR